MTGRRPVEVEPEMLAQIRNLFLGGKGIRRIAGETGLGCDVVRRRLIPIKADLASTGELPPPAKGGPARKVTPDIRQSLAKRLREGASLRRMALDVGISATVIAEALAPEIAEMKRRGTFNAFSGEHLQKRAAIVSAILNGDCFDDIGARFGVSGTGARSYLRHLSNDQRARRKVLEAARARRQSAPSRPHGDDLYARITAAIPYWLSEASRDDAISDLYVAVLQGQVAIADVPTVAARYARRTASTYENKFGPRSLDERLFDDGDATLGDMLVDPAALEAFDYIFEEAR